MKKVIIFGATDTGKRIYNNVKSEYEVICFVDEDMKKIGQTLFSLPIKDKSYILKCEYDYIIIGVLTRFNDVKNVLIDFNIPEYKIISKYVEIPTLSRIEFIKNLGVIFKELNIEGSVAELGVYQGEFAKTINEVFNDRILYLFDTFEGLPDNDVSFDNSQGLANTKMGHFSNTSEEMVLSKMYNKDKCIICKGYFPETAQNINDQFCFVNLDADLYKPTMEGLNYFYPKMVSKGIILIHDYFSESFRGVNQAVREFTEKNNIAYISIGDSLSVAIIK